MTSLSNKVIVFILSVSRGLAEYSHIDDYGNVIVDYSQYDEYEVPQRGYSHAYPRHAYPQDAYPNHAYPEDTYPHHAYPQHVYPHAYPKNTYSKYAYQQNAYPRQVYPKDGAPQKFWEDEFLRATEKTKKTKKKKKKGKREPIDKVFNPLPSYQVQATQIPESKYPWIAKVIHSPDSDRPYVCTAVLVETKIFITAAKCIYNLKVKITRVHYQGSKLIPKAFVTPDKPTRQMFDDVGIIVVYNLPSFNKWKSVSVIDVRRTDDNFKWFANLGYKENTIQHKVIGYAAKKEHPRNVNINTTYELTELDVRIDLEMCQDIMTKLTFIGYEVPCYSSCTTSEFTEKSTKCFVYHGTEGGAVYNTKTNKLLGVATWGGAGKVSQGQPELPVGFAVPNSDAYKKDLACAKKIMNSKTNNNGVYQVC